VPDISIATTHFTMDHVSGMDHASGMSHIPEAVETETNLTAHKAVATSLIRVLADTYSLYSTTRYVHMSVKSRELFTLQNLFEAHYALLARAVNETADRLRNLGYRVPSFGLRPHGPLDGAMERSTEMPRKPLNLSSMIIDLIRSHRITIDTCKECLRASSLARDAETEAYMATRVLEHKRAVGLLNSLLS